MSDPILWCVLERRDDEPPYIPWRLGFRVASARRAVFPGSRSRAREECARLRKEYRYRRFCVRRYVPGGQG